MKLGRIEKRGVGRRGKKNSSRTKRKMRRGDGRRGGGGEQDE
jgi:hypothetical protein